MAHQQHCQEVLDYILAHPERHNQEGWLVVTEPEQEITMESDGSLCGTTMCIAGAAAFLSGRLTFGPGTDGLYTYDLMPLHDGKPFHALAVMLGAPGDWYFNAGKEYLGLEYEQAEELFRNQDNDQAVRLLKEYANG